MTRTRTAPGILRTGRHPSLASPRGSRRRVVPLEHESQAGVIQWWTLACKGYGLPEFALFAVPNGSNKSIAAAMKFKREGLRSGIPDLFLAVPCKHQGAAGVEFLAAGLFVEMKRRGKKPSPEQEAVILYLRQRAYHVVVCYDSEEAVKAIKAYLA